MDLLTTHSRRRRPRAIPAVAAVFFAAWLIAGAAAAKDDKTSRLDRWRAEIQEIDALQKEGGKRTTRKAGKQAEKLFVEIRQRGWREPALKGILAEVATQVAIAEL
ncbi:MAG: hypothetical protein AAFY88_26855, partial [Acidobacteriota bacterium]